MTELLCENKQWLKVTAGSTVGSDTISDNRKPFQNDEKCFLFHVKIPFRS